MTEKEMIDLADDILQEYTNCYSEEDRDFLVKMLRKKIPEGAVVLTEGEYGDLLYDEVATIERDIAEYWATSDFDSVVKELHKNGYRKLDDHAVMVLRKAKGLEERIRKETAREFAEKIQDYLNDKVCEEFGDNACDVTYFTIDVDRVISDVFELAKHFGVEVEE